MSFDPLAARARKIVRAAWRDDPAWCAMIAALRPVTVSVEHIAMREISAPSWRPGLPPDMVAHAEGRKDLWRQLLTALKEE